MWRGHAHRAADTSSATGAATCPADAPLGAGRGHAQCAPAAGAATCPTDAPLGEGRGHAQCAPATGLEPTSASTGACAPPFGHAHRGPSAADEAGAWRGHAHRAAPTPSAAGAATCPKDAPPTAGRGHAQRAPAMMRGPASANAGAGATPPLGHAHRGPSTAGGAADGRGHAQRDAATCSDAAGAATCPKDVAPLDADRGHAQRGASKKGGGVCFLGHAQRGASGCGALLPRLGQAQCGPAALGVEANMRSREAISFSVCSDRFNAGCSTTETGSSSLVVAADERGVACGACEGAPLCLGQLQCGPATNGAEAAGRGDGAARDDSPGQLQRGAAGGLDRRELVETPSLGHALRG